MSAYLKSQIQMHIIVVIYGFTAILGKLIHTDAFVLVFYRTFIAALVLGVFIFFSKTSAAVFDIISVC